VPVHLFTRHSHALWFGLKGLHRRQDNGITGSHFHPGGWFDMLWIVAAASLFAIAVVLLLLHRRVKKKLEREIAF
jgi:hypothetical protein